MYMFRYIATLCCTCILLKSSPFRSRTPALLCDERHMSNSGIHHQESWHAGY